MTKETQILTILNWFTNGTTTEEVASVFGIQESDELINILSDGQKEYEAIDEEAGSMQEEKEVEKVLEDTYQSIQELRR